METQHAWETWVGRTEIASDRIGATPVAALHATFDDPAAEVPKGTPLPPLWHWLYCLPLHRQSDIGTDGHARRASFLPPVTLPRRMWAGGRLAFRTPLRVGDDIERTSTIEDVTMKEGRSGQLVFVNVRHEIRANGVADPAIVEWQDLVYRAAQKPEDPVPAPTKAPADARWVRVIVPDEVMLFRYSALTFNGHRIHYDRRYAIDVEGYPGLIVHGPLIATLLVDVVRRELAQATIETFRFRAVRPAFALNTLRLNCAVEPDGKTVRLWAEDHEGWLTMDASATIA